MKNRARLSDASLLAAVFVPTSQKIPAHLVTADENYLDLVNKVPGWFFWFSVGFAVAVWIFESIKEDSRVRQFWGWLTRKFEIEGMHVGRWDEDIGPMPQSDCGVRLHLKFRKTMRPARIRMHVVMCSDTGKEPLSKMFDMTLNEVVRGQIVAFPIVTIGLPQPGWDHERARGWGPQKEDNLIGGCGNIITIECEGRWTTQKHKIYVKSLPSNDGPAIFAIGENQPYLFECAFSER